MGVFLLFDAGGRLVQLAEQASGDFGAVEPQSVFFSPTDPRRETWRALEIAPEVLQGVRPRVWSLLVDHCRLKDGVVRVDTLAEMREKETRRALGARESAAFQAARELATIHLARAQYPRPTPPFVLAAIDRQKVLIEEALAEVDAIEAGEQIVHPDPILIGLAGQVVPL